MSKPKKKTAAPAMAQSISVNTSAKNVLINPYFLLILAVFIIIGILLFNAKIAIMGDDADYIMDAYNFVHRGIYPTNRSSLYSLVLGLPILLFGINVVLLKCFSFLCAIVGFVLLYKAFVDKIPNIILYPVLIFSAINASLQYYSSSNLSEAFFMMVQYGYLFVLFKFIAQGLKTGWKIEKKYWIWIGLAGLLISMSKNVAILIPFGITFFLLFMKRYKEAGYSVIAFLMFKIPYELLLRLLYKKNTVMGQLTQVLSKDLYHPEHGQETIGGFFVRFYKNISLYLSYVTFNEWGMPMEGLPTLLPGILLIALIAFGLYKAYKKNVYIFFTGIYVCILCGVTFFALQPEVAQARIIHIAIPLILLLVLYAVYIIFDFKKAAKSGKNIRTGILVVIFILVFITNIKTTVSAVQKTLPQLKQNLAGDKYFGYTPDYINYLSVGEWVKEFISEDAVIATRKPNALSVYSNGRNYLGLYTFPTDKTADELLGFFKANKIDYLIIPSLRANEEIVDPATTIRTIQKYALKISEKYPQSMEVIHTVGEGNEPCYVIKINYPEGFNISK